MEGDAATQLTADNKGSVRTTSGSGLGAITHDLDGVRPQQQAAVLKKASSSGFSSQRSSGAGSGIDEDLAASTTALASASPRHSAVRRHQHNQSAAGAGGPHLCSTFKLPPLPAPAPAVSGGGRPVIAVEASADSCMSLASIGLQLQDDDDKRRPGWWIQFKTLLARELLVTMRNPADVAGRMLLFTWVGAFCGLVFWRLGDGLDAARNRVNILFIIVQLFMLLPYVYMSLYAADRRHFTADISGRLYTPGPYYLAKTLGVLPFALANVLVRVPCFGHGIQRQDSKLTLELKPLPSHPHSNVTCSTNLPTPCTALLANYVRNGGTAVRSIGYSDPLSRRRPDLPDCAASAGASCDRDAK